MTARPLVIAALAALAALPVRPLLATEAPVLRIERVFVDASRVTPRNGTFPGANERTLRTLIWYPQGGPRTAPYPLLLMAHGFTGLPEKFDALARYIAARGYVVAAPAFPLTNQHAPGGPSFGDAGAQPQDLSFVLATLIAADDAGESPLGGLIDPAATAVLGHSLGGVSVQSLAFTDCCGPLPLRAVILAATPSVFAGQRLEAGPTTLVLHGTDDTIIPFDGAYGHFSALASARYLVGVLEGGHSALLESQVEPPLAARDITQRSLVAFLDAVLRGETAAFRQLLRELAEAQQVIVRPDCFADCDGDDSVAIADLVTGVAIAMQAAPLTACTPFDRDGGGTVTVDELLRGVRAALRQVCEE